MLSAKVPIILLLAIVIGVLVGLTWGRDWYVAEALQPAQPQPPRPKVEPLPDDQSPAPQNHRPAPWQPPGKDITNSIGMKFNRIPAGELLLVALPGTLIAGKPIPPEKIAFREPFYLGAYLVTQEDYEAVTNENPSSFQQITGAIKPYLPWAGMGATSGKLPAGIDTKRFPVECVSYEDARQFCVKLSALPAETAAGRQYRLPSEAEWEYACRAGSTATYSYGNDAALAGDYGWFADNSGGRPHPVGQKKPNDWGLYDMQGNVWQWCVNWYLPPYGVFRGVSWNYEAKDFPTAYRIGGHRDDYCDANTGFRVVCVVGLPQSPAGLATGNAPGELPPWAKGHVDCISWAIAQLSSDNLYNQVAACKSLTAMKVDGRRQAEVVQALKRMLDARARIRPRVQGVRALAVWGTAAEVPYLLRLFDDVDGGVQEAAIVALGKLKDARAADMLASRLNPAQYRSAASAALKEIGPAAEDAVRAQLQSTDNGARIEAIKILTVIGGPASQKDLIELTGDHFTDVAQAATEALPPELRPPIVDPKLCVTLNVHVADYRAWPAIKAQIMALADSPNPMCKAWRSVEYMWVTLGPVNVDADTFARRINFGKVIAVHRDGPLIYVETGR
jgi:formylglycine-generating enzyme required for sulfatase activity